MMVWFMQKPFFIPLIFFQHGIKCIGSTLQYGIQICKYLSRSNFLRNEEICSLNDANQMFNVSKLSVYMYLIQSGECLHMLI